MDGGAWRAAVHSFAELNTTEVTEHASTHTHGRITPTQSAGFWRRWPNSPLTRGSAPRLGYLLNLLPSSGLHPASLTDLTIPKGPTPAPPVVEPAAPARVSLPASWDSGWCTCHASICPGPQSALASLWGPGRGTRSQALHLDQTECKVHPWTWSYSKCLQHPLSGTPPSSGLGDLRPAWA